MIYFNCDYSEGAHPKILEKLTDTNFVQTEGYGTDCYCEQAKRVIKAACKNDQADVHFLTGGTQANLTVIASALRPYQGVLCAATGHINVHETGAIEACGHKVLPLPSKDGKITARQIDDSYKAHVNDESFEHIVQPKMVYISQPTELGTLYSLNELTEISKICRDDELLLYVDGARLGYGLTAKDNTVSLPDLARLCDVFYIGGTKIGALLGEAVVITNPSLKKDFRYIIKQKGGMLAKGRLLGIQFIGLFEDDLYIKLCRHANQMADLIRTAFSKAGYSFLIDNSTNQLFPILSDSKLDKLKEKYAFSYQQRVDETHSAVRFCTSWATQRENVEYLIKDIENL